MKWTEKYRVNNLDTDLNGILSLSGILRYMQDTAFCHMEAAKPSYEDLFNEGKAFFINRMTLSIYKAIRSHDEIEVETWAAESSGLSFMRCFRVLSGGEIAAEAVTAWSLYNYFDKKFIRVSDFESGYGTDEMPELDFRKMLRIPKELELSLVGEHTVRYRDVDMNRHMNNTVYGDLLCGYLADMEEKQVIKFDINYRNEAPLGETVKVYMKSDGDGTCYFRTQCEGRVNAEALIMTDRVRPGK